MWASLLAPLCFIFLTSHLSLITVTTQWSSVRIAGISYNVAWCLPPSHFEQIILLIIIIFTYIIITPHYYYITPHYYIYFFCFFFYSLLYLLLWYFFLLRNSFKKSVLEILPMSWGTAASSGHTHSNRFLWLLGSSKSNLKFNHSSSIDPTGFLIYVISPFSSSISHLRLHFSIALLL